MPVLEGGIARSGRLKVAFGLALFIGVSAATAQGQVGPIAVGDRLRVTAPLLSTDPVVGTVQEISAEVLTLRREVDARDVRLPLDSVWSVELSVGSRSASGLGVLVGLGVGATVGYLLAGDCEKDQSCWFGGREVGVVVWAPLGALVGMLVGVNQRTEEWISVPLTAVRAPRLIDGGADLMVVSIRTPW